MLELFNWRFHTVVKWSLPDQQFWLSQRHFYWTFYEARPSQSNNNFFFEDWPLSTLLIGNQYMNHCSSIFCNFIRMVSTRITVATTTSTTTTTTFTITTTVTTLTGIATTTAAADFILKIFDVITGQFEVIYISIELCLQTDKVI